MYGLIKKDFLMLKQNLKIIMLVFIMFLTMTMLNESNMTFILPFMAIMISISTFSYDSFNKWDAYAITLPNGRKNVITAKYISTMIFVLLSFIVSLTTLIILNNCGVNIDFSSSFSELLGCLFAAILIMSIMFPIIYKFGIEKARITLFLIAFVITSLTFLFLQNITTNIPESIITFFNNYYKIILPLVACCLVFISYIISLKTYSKKEF